MATGAKEVWVFQIVHQDTGKPAQGRPVTVVDAPGNAAGCWVSDADGTVAIPRREPPRLRMRVGLRNEEPIELARATLGEGPTPLAAPTQLPPAAAASGERQALPATPPPPTPAEQTEVPGHVLYFQRLAMFAERAPAPPGPRDAVADFFTPPADGPAAMRYGVVIEVGGEWQTNRVLWGEVVYRISLTPGDERKLAGIDGPW